MGKIDHILKNANCDHLTDPWGRVKVKFRAEFLADFFGFLNFQELFITKYIFWNKISANFDAKMNQNYIIDPLNTTNSCNNPHT
jgi:hypothetical protein